MGIVMPGRAAWPTTTADPLSSCKPMDNVSMSWISTLPSSVTSMFGDNKGFSILQPDRQQRGRRQRQRDAGDTGGPAQPIEHLAEQRAADEPTEKITGEIDAARRAAVGRGGTADKAGRRGLREERADADQRQPEQHRGELSQQQQRQAEAGKRQRRPE